MQPKRLKRYTASTGGGNYFRIQPGSYTVSRAEMHPLICEGAVFDNIENEAYEIFQVLVAVDPVNRKDAKLMDRIIKAGGFVAYIEKLESLL